MKMSHRSWKRSFSRPRGPGLLHGGELAASERTSLRVADVALRATLVGRCGRPRRVGHRLVVTAQSKEVLLVAALPQPVDKDGRLEVLRLDAAGRTAEELERTPDRPEKRGHSLVENQVVVGVAAVAQRRDEQVRRAPLALVRDPSDLAEVDLGLLAEGVTHPAVDLGLGAPKRGHLELHALI
jgi:hypothetical protein